MAAPANAVTTVAAIQAEGQGLDTVAAATLERYLGTASEMIERYLNRLLPLATVTELHDGARGAIKLLLDRWPIVGALSSITVLDLGAAVANDGSDFVIDDAETGKLHRDKGWAPSDLGGLGAAYEPMVGISRQRYSVTYAGGYVLPGPAWTTATAFVAGGLVQPTSASNLNVFRAGAAGVTGTPQPTWPAVGATVVDGTITWTNLGPRTVPYPIEQACLDMVGAIYRGRGGNRGLISETVGAASRAYGAAGRLVMSDPIKQMLDPYRRIF